MRLKFLLSFLLLLAGCSSATHQEPPSAKASSPLHRMGEVGNGGHGVLLSGKVYLLDLVERGGERGSFPEITIAAEDKRRLLLRLHAALGDGDFPWEGLVSMLTYLHRSDPILAYSLLEAMGLYHWSFVERDLSLLPVPGNILDLSEGDLVLIANRRGRTVHVCLPYWRMMDDWNRAALIVHEMVSSLVPPEEISLAGGAKTLRQNAARARELTAGLFDVVGNRLHRGSLLDAVAPGELPISEATPGHEFSQSSTVASSYLTYGDFHSRFRGSLPPEIEAIVGPVSFEATIVESHKGDGTTYRFRYPFNQDSHEAIHALCKEQIWGRSLRLTMVFDNDAGYKAPVELSFASYQDGEETKTYLRQDREFEKLSFAFDQLALVPAVGGSLTQRFFYHSLVLDSPNCEKDFETYLERSLEQTFVF